MRLAQRGGGSLTDVEGQHTHYTGFAAADIADEVNLMWAGRRSSMRSSRVSRSMVGVQTVGQPAVTNFVASEQR